MLPLTITFLSGISNAEARQPGKAPNFSVNWTVGDTGLEVINATTGKDEMGRASRLCKHAFYSRWMRIHAKVHVLECWGFRCLIPNQVSSSIQKPLSEPVLS